MTQEIKEPLSEALRLLDIILFAGEDDRDVLVVRARKCIMHALMADEVMEMARMAEPEPMPEVKPNKPVKKRPKPQSPKPVPQRQREGWVKDCPKCGVRAGQPCISVGPVKKGKVAVMMHKERAGTSVPNYLPKEQTNE